MSRVFINCLGDWGSIRGQVIPKTQKMILDAALLNTQHYEVRIKDKSGAIKGTELHTLLHLVVVAIEKGAFRSLLTKVANFNMSFNKQVINIKSTFSCKTENS